MTDDVRSARLSLGRAACAQLLGDRTVGLALAGRANAWTVLADDASVRALRTYRMAGRMLRRPYAPRRTAARTAVTAAAHTEVGPPTVVASDGGVGARPGIARQGRALPDGQKAAAAALIGPQVAESGVEPAPAVPAWQAALHVAAGWGAELRGSGALRPLRGSAAVVGAPAGEPQGPEGRREERGSSVSESRPTPAAVGPTGFAVGGHAALSRSAAPRRATAPRDPDVAVGRAGGEGTTGKDQVPTGGAGGGLLSSGDAAADGAGRSGEGRMAGDVYLDGDLVGRWVEARLTQSAGRAPSGPNFFDMRSTAPWPGAPLGY